MAFRLSNSLNLAVRHDRADHSPVEQVVDGDELMDADDEPEQELETEFGVLVSNPALGEKRPGPAAGEREELQGVLRRSPFFLLRALLVVGVDEVSERGHCRVPAHENPPAFAIGQFPTGDCGRHQEHGEEEKVIGAEGSHAR